MNRLILVCQVALVLQAAPPLLAQDPEVPRTRTFPGIEDPTFPYARAEAVGLSSRKLERLGDEITKWVANGDLVGAELLIVKDRRTVFHEAYGWSDREESEPVARNSIWSIKSMSKPVTATATLMLAEEGRLSLDDPVSRYMPAFQGDERTTIRHLLTHTSGAEGGEGGGGYDVYYFDSLRDWVEDSAQRERTGTFGEFAYSNFNYAALGYIVEAVSGVPVETFTERRIIEPLGLDETYTTFSPDVSWAPRVSSRYRFRAEAGDYERIWSNRDPQPWAFYAAGFGLWATGMDYAEFMAMWLDRGRYGDVRMLAEETVEEALEPLGASDGVSYGYGWFVEQAQDTGETPHAFSHVGGDGTIAIAFPADDALVIYLTHSQGIGHLDALRDRIGMLGIFDYPGTNMVWADQRHVAEVELSSEEQARYAGTFRPSAVGQEDDSDFVVRVWEEDGILHLSAGQAGVMANIQSHLVPLGADRFAPGRYEGGRLEAIDPYTTIRLILERGKAGTFQLVAGGEVALSAERVDEGRLVAEMEEEQNRVSIATIVRETLEDEGIEAARVRHRVLLASRPDSIRFAVSLLDELGHWLLREGRVEEAIAVFAMNAEAYPEVPITHGGLGEAYSEAGRLREAKQRFERAVTLSEEQAHLDWRMYWRIYRAHLERVTQQLANR